MILLTGFEPWAEHARNPSGEAAAAVGGRVLPVHYGRAERALRELRRGPTPSAVVLSGLAAGRTSIQLETRAYNEKHTGRPISPAGASFRKSTLPLDVLLRRLRADGLPAEISHDAGRFLCNHVFYVARGLWPGIPVGFVHLPPLEVLPLGRQIRALRLIRRVLEEATARGGRRGSPEAARNGAGRGIRRS